MKNSINHVDGHPFYIPVALAEKRDGQVYHVIAWGDTKVCARWCNGVWREPIVGEPLESDAVTAVFTNPTLYQVQQYIHEQNVERGWWDTPRSYSVFTNLFHSEASEALEGHRKSLNDDKLPQYLMPVVEAADLAIRIMDYLGSIGNTRFTDHIDPSQYVKGDFHRNLAMCHYWISQAWFERVNLGVRHEHYLRHALRLAMHIIDDYEKSPIHVILEKVAFNAVRPDHDRENRKKPGGKEY